MLNGLAVQGFRAAVLKDAGAWLVVHGVLDFGFEDYMRC